jgi:hypothetical protein
MTPAVALAPSIAGFRKAASSCGLELRSEHLTAGDVSWQGGGCVATGVGVGVGVGVTTGVGWSLGPVELPPPHEGNSAAPSRTDARMGYVFERKLQPPC